MYMRWRRLLPRWLRIVPLELPGRGSHLGEDLVEDYAQLVSRLCAEYAHELRGSYALFGHSMGALLAYGMAAHLRDQAMPLPQAVFVSGSAAPSRRDDERYVGKDNDDALIADLRKQGGTPEEVFANAELMRMTLDVLGADYRVCESFQYQAGHPLSLPVHAFSGRDDDMDAASLQAWQDETTGRFTLDWFDGGHFFIRQHEAQVLSTLVRQLARFAPGISYANTAVA